MTNEAFLSRLASVLKVKVLNGLTDCHLFPYLRRGLKCETSVSDMNEIDWGSKCIAPGCSGAGEIVADSYMLVKLGVVRRRGRVCQTCFGEVQADKRQLLSKLQNGGRGGRTGGNRRTCDGGTRSRTELDEAPEVLTLDDSDVDEVNGETSNLLVKDSVEVQVVDRQVEEVVKKMVTKMGLQSRLEQEERNLRGRAARVQGQMGTTREMFKSLERETQEIHQLLYEVTYHSCCTFLSIIPPVKTLNIPSFYRETARGS